MPKYKPSSALYKWLSKQEIVGVAYFDDCHSVNLDYLLALWIDCRACGNDFGDSYPNAADYLQVVVSAPRDEVELGFFGADNLSQNNPTTYCQYDSQSFTYQEVINRIKFAKHAKVWINGEEVENFLGDYKLKLYDPQGCHKMTETFTQEKLAWAEGENWKILTEGNSYEITNVTTD